MIRPAIRRLAILPPALLLVNFLGFTYAHLVRPLRAARTPYLMQVLPEAIPLKSAYLDYIKSLFSLDLGLIPTGQETMVSALGNAVVASYGLLGLALGLSVLIGMIIGLISARTEPARISRWLPLFSTIGLAMPSFYIGSLFLLGLFAYVLWRPATGLPLPFSGFGWDQHLILPTLALMLRPTVYIAHVTSGFLVDEFDKQYVLATRSLGRPWSVVRRRHAFRNILAPVILTVSRSLRFMVGDLILVEWLFGWPGIGGMLALALIPSSVSFTLGSTFFLNPSLVATILTLIAALFLVADLIALILVRVVDPRLRISDGENVNNI